MNKDDNNLDDPSIEDPLVWCRALDKHAFGDFSFAVVQANAVLEDQSQVEIGREATFVGVYDGHGGPDAARYISDHLFLHLMSEFLISLLLLFQCELCLVVFDSLKQSLGFGIIFHLLLNPIFLLGFGFLGLCFLESGLSGFVLLKFFFSLKFCAFKTGPLSDMCVCLVVCL